MSNSCIITTNINEAVLRLRQGRLVAIPTETVYGLAANAEEDAAVRSIFTMKNRPATHPLILHVADGCDIRQWVEEVPPYAQQLMDAFWPGPLTLVFRAKANRISPLVTGGQTTVAIRCPKHPVTQALLSALDFPLVAPSANPFGKISPTTARHVQQSFPGKNVLILDGGRSVIGIESTIVSAVDEQAYRILRQGMIDEHSLRAVLHQDACIDDSDLRVPGKLDNHYQPEKNLYAFEQTEQLQDFCRKHPDAYVLSFQKDALFGAYAGYQMPAHPEQLAFELYFQLRLADQSSAPLIAMDLPPQGSAWDGIRERVLKACTA